MWLRASFWERPFASMAETMRLAMPIPARARPEERDSLRSHRRILGLQRGRQSRQRDAGRALDIIVVAEHLVPISVEKPDRIGDIQGTASVALAGLTTALQ